MVLLGRGQNLFAGITVSPEVQQQVRRVARETTSFRQFTAVLRGAGFAGRDTSWRVIRNEELQKRDLVPRIRSVRDQFRPGESVITRTGKASKTRYYYEGSARITVGTLRDKDYVPVNFGSDELLTMAEIKAEVEKIARDAEVVYGLRLIEPSVYSVTESTNIIGV